MSVQARDRKIKVLVDDLGSGVYTLNHKGKQNKFNISKFEREKLKNKIDKKIGILIDSIKRFDPLHVLNYTSLNFLLMNEKNYSEKSEEPVEAYAEYILSIIIGLDDFEFKDCTEKDIKPIFKQVKKIFFLIDSYFSFEQIDKTKGYKKDLLRSNSILRYLYVRGNAYKKHYFDLTKELFSPHNNFLKTNFALEIEEIINSIDEIEKQLQQNIIKIRDVIITQNEVRTFLVEFLDKNKIYSEEIDLENIGLPQSILDKIEFIQKKNNELKEIGIDEKTPCFKIVPNNILSNKFLELFSTEMKTNKNLVDIQSSPPWPTNDSIIFTKPLIKHNNSFYCFIPQIFSRNIINILEYLIEKKDTNYFNQKYKDKCGKILEKKSIDYISKLLPKSKIYTNLYYKTTENGKEKRNEADGLIIFDDKIILLESKGNSLSLSAKRGSIDRIKSNTKDIIQKAYEQGIRTKKYIKNNETVIFTNEKNKEVLRLLSKDFKKIFIINTTLDYLGHLSTNLDLLREFDFVKDEWIWSVNIYDLRVISEILDSTSEFLLFLERRIKAHSYKQFDSIDELDVFMYFLKKGLYFEDGILENVEHFTPLNYTKELDSYYINAVSKPKFNILPEYKEFIQKIEKINKKGFSTVSTLLISFNTKQQQELLNHLYKMISKTFLTEMEQHDLSYNNLGVTFLTLLNDSQNNVDFIKLKMYKLKYERWICVKIFENKIDFDIYNQKWEFNSKLAKLVHASINTYKEKIGPNVMCPCHSGKKYKKCTYK